MTTGTSSSPPPALQLPRLPLLCLETARELTTHDLLVEPDGASCWTVIDFWTTRCTRCPAAMDALNERVATMAAVALKENADLIGSEAAADDDLGIDIDLDMDFDTASSPTTITTTTSITPHQYHKTRFYSICCGESSDTARSILEQGDLGVSRWPYIRHYYMDTPAKEVAKAALQFAQVPFYVILDAFGDIVQAGNSKAVDWSVLQQSVSTNTDADEVAVARVDETIADDNGMEVDARPVVTVDMDDKVGDNVDVLKVSPTSIAEPIFCLDDMDF